MNYQALQLAAEQVIAAINKTAPASFSVDVLAPIKLQMEFIYKHAAAGNNPSAELLTDIKFNYAVLAPLDAGQLRWVSITSFDR